jgi:heme-degrading monooxygenase HmoA
MMAITVFIQRKFSGKEKATQLAPLIVEIRSLATMQPGYITGKTFRCMDCPGEYIVISTWNSLDDWNNWLQSKKRINLQKQIDDLLGEVTQYRIYEPLVGGIIPQFQAGSKSVEMN